MDRGLTDMFFKLMAVFAIGYSAFLSGSVARDQINVNICSGPELGSYWNAGETMARLLAKSRGNNFIVQNIPTEGSYDNVSRSLDMEPDEAECNIFIAQPDVMLDVARKEPGLDARIEPLAQLHDEYAVLLVNREGRVNSLADLESYGIEATLVVGDKDYSGAAATWRNLTLEDPDYAPVRVSSKFEDTESALSALALRQVDAILMITGGVNPTLQEAADYMSDKLTIGAVNDGDFDGAVDLQGEKLLHSVNIFNNEVTKKLGGCNWTCVNTYKMQAQMFMVSSAFDKKDKKAIRRAARRAAEEIRSTLNE